MRNDDVAIARWTSMDPANEFHSPYVYVGGDPVNLVDPDGRQSANTENTAPNSSSRLNPQAYTAEAIAARAAQRSTPSLTNETSNLTIASLGAGAALNQLAFGSAAARESLGNPRGGHTWLGDMLAKDPYRRRGVWGKLDRIARYSKYAGRLFTAAGVASASVQAYQNPEVLRRPSIYIDVTLGVGSLFAWPVAVGAVGYYATDWYCEGESAGVCGTFNYLTDTPFGELMNDAGDAISSPE